MQSRAVTLRIAAPDFFAGQLICLCRNRLWFGQSLPNTESNPGTLLLASTIDVEQAHSLAILLQFVLNLAAEGQRRRPRQVDTTILQILAIVDCDWHEPAGLGMTFLAGPLQHPDGAHCWAVLTRLGHLPWVLGAGWQRYQKRGQGK